MILLLKQPKIIVSEYLLFLTARVFCFQTLVDISVPLPCLTGAEYPQKENNLSHLFPHNPKVHNNTFKDLS